MTDNEQTALKGCPKCDGQTVQFKGRGRDLQYRICSQFEQAGHLSREQIEQKINAEQQREYPRAFPSGRWA